MTETEDQVEDANWCVQELEVCMTAYLQMLSMELNGEKYNKSEFNRNVRSEGVNRSASSIEYRMQNLSSFFAGMKVPTIAGYKPSGNIGKNVHSNLTTIYQKLKKSELWKRVADQINVDVLETIRTSFAAHRRNLSQIEIDQKSNIIFEDLILLARCAHSKCLISYENAIKLRGHGIPLNGQWLDEVFAHAIEPLGFYDLTVLVVNKGTKNPSSKAFDARRTFRSRLTENDVPLEQKRCIWDTRYEKILGELAEIPSEYQSAGRILTPQSAKEKEISRAVRNAINRAGLEGSEKSSIGKSYPGTLAISELTKIVGDLWEKQQGKCALTSKPFDLRSAEEGGIQEDFVSLDRKDNAQGYNETNVQLVTQFANRARGTLSVDEARKRLVQFNDK